jgi:tetratricopeptide (TPR) repeat protein
VWEQPASGAPLLSLSLNDATELELHRGWPLIVRASVLHPAAFAPGPEPAAPVAIADAGAALRVRVVNPAGEAQSWPLHAASPLPAELRLERDASADTAWWLDGAETAALPDGRYALVAELGAATSPPALLTLSPEPAPLPPERAREKRLRALELLLLRGDHAAARAEVDALLRADADDLAALEASGDLYAAEGRKPEAFEAYSRALHSFFERDPKPPEPPVALLRKRQAVMQDAFVAE